MDVLVMTRSCDAEWGRPPNPAKNFTLREHLSHQHYLQLFSSDNIETQCFSLHKMHRRVSKILLSSWWATHLKVLVSLSEQLASCQLRQVFPFRFPRLEGLPFNTTPDLLTHCCLLLNTISMLKMLMESSLWKMCCFCSQPAVAVGNVAQLAVDLIVSTLNMSRVGFIHTGCLIPMAGNNPYTTCKEDAEELHTPAEGIQ